MGEKKTHKKQHTTEAICDSSTVILQLKLNLSSQNLAVLSPGIG